MNESEIGKQQVEKVWDKKIEEEYIMYMVLTDSNLCLVCNVCMKKKKKVLQFVQDGTTIAKIELSATCAAT